MDFDFSPVETLDKVPESFRPLYDPAAKDGKFHPIETHKPVIDGIKGLTTALATERKNKPVKVDLSPLADYGDTPEKIAENVKTKITEAGGAAGKEISKQVNAAKEGMIAAHQTELTKRDARAAALQTQLYALMVENTATAAVAELKGVPELLMPFIRNQVKVVEEDGQFKVTVVNDKAEVRYGATGSPMTIRELVVEMKANAKYGRLFESEHQNGGGGKPPGNGATPPANNGQERSSVDKISAGLRKGVRRGT